MKNEVFHILTIGWGRSVINRLWKRIESKSEDRFSHILHPKYCAKEWPKASRLPNLHFFRDQPELELPVADRELLASLESAGVPTVHNMIMSDRVVSRLPYNDAIRYATFLARRLRDLIESIGPSVIIGGFDALHSGIACGVAKKLQVPWFAMNFSVLPPGYASFCEGMTPGSRTFHRPVDDELRALADSALKDFENRRIQAHAYVAAPPLPLVQRLVGLPKYIASAARLARRSRRRDSLKYVELRSGHDIQSALHLRRRGTKSRRDLSRSPALMEPPERPFVFFGFHLQPESSIDVWAPFFSNQLWVVETISRAIPPTHDLLVKIHKSDVANYPRSKLKHILGLPGVRLVAPFADSRRFIESANLVIAIQGTIGLEAALLGKPVIMLGDSPVTSLPSASRLGEVSKLPELVREKLRETAPSRQDIVQAYASFLSPFSAASLNYWDAPIGDETIDNYVRFLQRLKENMIGYEAPGCR